MTQNVFTEDILPHTSRIERMLLTLAGGFLLMNFFALAILQEVAWQPSLQFFVWVGCALGGTWVLDRNLPNRDPLLFPLAMFLGGWGLVLVDRLAPNFADRQTLWLVLATGIMLATTSLPQLLRWLR